MTTRRELLARSAAAAGAVVVTSCTSKDNDKPKSPVETTTTAATSLAGDLRMVTLAAGLENLAVATYQAVLDLGVAGKLVGVPPAVMSFVQTTQSHHRDHAVRWNAILTGAGRPRVHGVDLTAKTMVDQLLVQVRDVPSIGRLALSLEDIAASTYVQAIPTLINSKIVQTAASIQPVEMQHAAVLSFLLGQLPVPAAFAKRDSARPTTDVVG